jgi:hypothetical protein
MYIQKAAYNIKDGMAYSNNVCCHLMYLISPVTMSYDCILGEKPTSTCLFDFHTPIAASRP